MALNQSSAPSSGIWNAIKGAMGIFADVNKASGVTENTNPQPQDEFKSEMTDEQITELTANWKRTYATYYADIDGSQKTSFEYWIGKHNMEEAGQLQGDRPMVDNLIFEAVETFIPIATRANPDPLVSADPTEIGQKLAHDLKEALVHEADRMKLRKVLKRMLRHWLIYKIGVLKYIYNVKLDQIEVDVVNPKRMIFDKDGYIDESGKFKGEYLGEKIQTTAENLINLFPEKEAEILEKAKGKLGTKIEYISWWYRGTDNFFTMESTVLGKFKNPHWNYDTPEVPEIPAVEGTEEVLHPETDQILQHETPHILGVPAVPPVPGVNHLSEPEAPYTFLGIFSTGLQPHDETSLITQNVGLQDMVNRRYRQIDDNVRKMNNGIVVSADFTAEQASQAASAAARGTAIRAPGTDVNKAIMRLPAPPIPAQVFQMLEDGRGQIKNIFGTSGSTPEAVGKEDTARGKILVNQLDASRIGGGITEYLEQIAATAYNYWVQLMFVHWTDEHYVVAAGSVGGSELVTIKNTDFLTIKTLTIGVKEGSLIPKDPLTQRNEAIDLWSANAIDPVNFYKKLDFADPTNAAQQLIIWQMVQKGQLPPQAYIPTFQIAGQPAPPMGMPPQGGQVPGVPGQGGVGDQNINTIGTDKADVTDQPATASPEQQGKQLLESVPIK